MNAFDATLTILGLALVTALTRGLLLLPKDEVPMPAWVKRALKYAPLAALTAIIAPEVLLTRGELIPVLTDARLLGAVAGIAYFFWQRGILGTIVVGMLVFLPLRIGLGW